MKLVLTHREATEKIKRYLRTLEAGRGFFGLSSVDSLLNKALESTSSSDIEKLVKELGGTGRVFNVQGDLELSIR